MRFWILFSTMLYSFGLAANTQVLVDESLYYADYELRGDSLIFTFEFLNSTALHLNPNDSSELDVAFLQIDHNQNGEIDQNTLVDRYYTLDSSNQNMLCAGNLIDAQTLSNCGSFTSNARFTYELAASAQSNSPHPIYQLSIPQSELFNGSHVCTRASIIFKQHNQNKSNFPNYSGNQFFVEPYYPIQLFPRADLGNDLELCEDTTFNLPADYPFHFWNNLNQENTFEINRATFESLYPSGKLTLTVRDNTCNLGDEIDVQINSDEFCEGDFFTFPNIITPNNDNINDVFEPIIGDEVLNRPEIFEGAELFIYNRWGLLVHQGFNYPSWDAYTNTGKIAAAGTYFYTFKLNDDQNTVFNGSFNIVE